MEIKPSSNKCPIGHYCDHMNCFCPRDVPSNVVEFKRKTRVISTEAKKRQKKLKVATGKHTTISQIAKAIHRSPRECRAALRSLDIKKPAHGWSWAASEASVIKSRLEKRFGGKSSRAKLASAHPEPPSVAATIPADNVVSFGIGNKTGSGGA